MNRTSDDRRLLLAVAAVVLVSVVLYRGLFSWLLDQWLTDRLYSHGFIVPLVSLYLLWTGRERFKYTPIRAVPVLGAAILLASAALLFAGRWGAFVQFESISYLLFLPGVILSLWGFGYLRVLLFPVFYLQFMVPWLDPILSSLQKPFQLISAHLSVGLFKLCNIPVYQNGIFIDLPGISLEVAKECSGVHFILSVMAVGIPLVYLTQRTWKRAAVVLLAGGLITVLANGLRITIDGFLGMRYGVNLLHGPGHIFRGWFVAQVGWVGIFVVNWLVGRGGDHTLPRLCDHWRSKVASQPDPVRISLRRFWVMGVGLLVALLVLEAAAPPAVSLHGPIGGLPQTIGQWTGRDVDWPEAREMLPGVQASVSRVYKDGAGRQLRLFIGYCAVQRDGKTLVSYHAGPLYEDTDPVPTALQKPWPSDIGKGELRLGGVNHTAAFWYQFPGFGTSRKLPAKLGTVRSALLERRTNGMVVLVAMPVSRRGPDAEPSRAIADFIDRMRPHLAESMPMSGS